MSAIGAKVLSSGDDSQFDVDIVFVHGLRGHRKRTWSHGDVFWPKDLLGHDISKARVISWGYDADVVKFLSGPSQASIYGHAIALLADIAQERFDTVRLFILASSARDVVR